MSTRTESVTVKQLLLPGEEPPPVLRRACAAAMRGRVDAAITRLTPIGLDILGASIGQVVGGMLNVDVGDIVRSALTAHRRIADAMRTTAADPRTEVLVTIAEHTFESDFDPSVDVIADGVTVVSIAFQVALDAHVEGCLLVIAGGRVAAVRTGRTTLSATLSCQGVTIAEHHEDIDFAGVLRLPSADTRDTRGVRGSVLAS
jgi:hypothetical protein